MAATSGKGNVLVRFLEKEFSTRAPQMAGSKRRLPSFVRASAP